MAAVKKKKGLMYKGKPLLRCGNRIYYGNLEDSLFLLLTSWKAVKSKMWTYLQKLRYRLWTTQVSLAKVRFIVSAKEKIFIRLLTSVNGGCKTL